MQCLGLCFLYLYAEDVGWTEHVGAEDDHLAVRREAYVGFEGVVVLRHVDQALRVEHAGLHEVLALQACVL